MTAVMTFRECEVEAHYFVSLKSVCGLQWNVNLSFCDNDLYVLKNADDYK